MVSNFCEDSSYVDDFTVNDVIGNGRDSVSSSAGNGSDTGIDKINEKRNYFHSESPSTSHGLNHFPNHDSSLSPLNCSNNGTSEFGGNAKRKVPKVFSKEAITKFRSWLFHNLTVA